MSFDFAMQHICGHEVFYETVPLDSLKQTARFLRPPSSSRVQVFIDGEEIPRNGLISTPEISFVNPESYTIRKNKNDLLYLKIGTDIPRFYNIEAGMNLKASDIVRDLKSKVPSLNFSVVNGRVNIKSKTPVLGTAFSFPDPRWTDKTASLTTTARVLAFFNSAGITPGRSVFGKQLFSGWDLVQDPTISLEDEKLLRFREPLYNQNPFIQVHYVTNAAFCRRCFGSRIEFDYTVKNGTYETVENADLLSQELDKFLFTKIGSHFKWNWLGSGLVNRVGGKSNAAGTAINAVLTTDIVQAFQTYQDVKSQQDNRFPFQKVSDAEFPYSLNNIDVVIPPDDPTIAVVSVDISTRSLQPIELKRVVGNPSPYTLSQNPELYIRLSQNNNSFLLRG